MPSGSFAFSEILTAGGALPSFVWPVVREPTAFSNPPLPEPPPDVSVQAASPVPITAVKLF